MKRIPVGIDEVGRGPVAGPVTVGVCAVYDLKKILKNAPAPLRDSKQLSKIQREVWAAYLKDCVKNGWCNFAVCSMSAAVIDRRGIVPAIRSALVNALKKLAIDPDTHEIFLDGGLKAPAEYIHQKTIIKGDTLIPVISLASIMAKVTRDSYMTRISKKYPAYGFEKHVGYGTQAHYQAMKKHGLTSEHRRYFLSKFLDKDK